MKRGGPPQEWGREGPGSSGIGEANKGHQHGDDVVPKKSRLSGNVQQMNSDEGRDEPAEPLPGGGPGSSSGDRSIYVGGLAPSITEGSLRSYFAKFGPIEGCKVVRDKDSGISRGFGFVTFALEKDADAALDADEVDGHVVDGRSVRVSASSSASKPQKSRAQRALSRLLDRLALLVRQSKVYVGPLDDDVAPSDLMTQFARFGAVKGVTLLRSSETAVKRGFGTVDFREGIPAVSRSFGSREVFVRGKPVKVVALSRFAVEVLLSDTVVFFYDAHEHIEEALLEAHFSRFGRVFRALHLPNLPEVCAAASSRSRSYGFVDFVTKASVDLCLANRSQLLLHPGQYIKVGKTLPQALALDLMAIGDGQGEEIRRRLEQSIPNRGFSTGRGGNNPRKIIPPTLTSGKGGQGDASRVRIPSSMVPRLIGERGKTITEISRNSGTKVSIPPVEDGQSYTVVSISGTAEGIKMAQYLMQKLLRGSDK